MHGYVAKLGQVAIKFCPLKKKKLSLAGGFVRAWPMFAAKRIGHAHLKAQNFYEVYGPYI